jgi:hypothetical protein
MKPAPRCATALRDMTIRRNQHGRHGIGSATESAAAAPECEPYNVDVRDRRHAELAHRVDRSLPFLEALLDDLR